MIKIGQPRSKIQAKTYKFLWGGGGGGLRGHKGKYFVHKSNIYFQIFEDNNETINNITLILLM